MKTIKLIVDELPVSCEECIYQYEYHGDLLCGVFFGDNEYQLNVEGYISWLHDDINWKPQRHPDCKLEV